jgi:hypothetical protein
MATGVDLIQLPTLDGVTRTVYVSAEGPEAVSSLEQRGYTVVDIFTLPRETPEDHQRFLLAKMQGVEEGTICSTQKDIRALEVAMRAHGLLDKTSRHLNLNVAVDGQTVEQLLGWSDSRHTLRGNSTVQSAQVKGKGEKTE